MKKIVYISVRNTLIGRGNFGKPVFLENVLKETPLDEVFSLALEGNASFFDENGDTIEMEDSVYQLRNMLHGDDATSNASNVHKFLVIHGSGEIDLLDKLMLQLNQNRKILATSKFMKVEELDQLIPFFSQTQTVGLLVTENFDYCAHSLLLACLIAAQYKKQIVIISSVGNRIGISGAAVKDEMLNQLSKFSDNTFIHDKIMVCLKQLPQVIAYFKKRKCIDIDDLDKLKFLT